jgi:hypothetical protein
MTDIPLTVTPQADGNDIITWQPPPGVGSYRLQRDGKWVSSSYDPEKTSWRVKRGGAYRLVAYGPVFAEGNWPTTTPPPPTGTPVNTNGRNDIIVANQTITIPPSPDKDVACVYVSGASQRTHVGGNLKLEGGYLCIKQYGLAKDLTIDGVDVGGAAGDLMHFDGATNVHVDNVYGHDPVYGVNDAEHHDYCQIQSGSGYYFGPGCVADWPVDFPNNCYMISLGKSAVDYLYDVTLDRVTIRGPKHGNAIQMFCGGTIISPTIEGPPAEKISLNRPPDGRKIVLRSAATGMWANGVRRADVYCNDYQGAGWPDYVQIDP